MSLRLVLYQTAPRLGAVDENLAAIHQALGTTPPGSLCVFPELALTGYDLGARARELALEEDAPPPVKSPDAATTVIPAARSCAATRAESVMVFSSNTVTSTGGCCRRSNVGSRPYFSRTCAMTLSPIANPTAASGCPPTSCTRLS